VRCAPREAAVQRGRMGALCHSYFQTTKTTPCTASAVWRPRLHPPPLLPPAIGGYLCHGKAAAEAPWEVADLHVQEVRGWYWQVKPRISTVRMHLRA